MRKHSKTLLMIRFFFFSFLIIAALMAQSAVGAPTENYPVVKLRSLDKITARTETFEAKVGATVQFGPLYIKVQACRKAPPIEKPEAAAFLQIWEVDTDNQAQWVFSGWMFASSPALSPMDHAIYDVWVLDCLNEQAPEKADDELAEENIPQQPEGTAVPGSSPDIKVEPLSAE